MNSNATEQGNDSMNVIRRQFSPLLICGLILVYFFIGSRLPSPVSADVGVQPILPGGSSIRPEEPTPIRMASEVVVMNIRPAAEADNTLIKIPPKTYGLQSHPVWFPAVAEVEADFMMENPTGSAVSMAAWFPLASALENVDWNLNPNETVSRIESFDVNVDGNPVGYAVVELPNPKGADKPLLPWASFEVTFPAEMDTIIHVSYSLPLQPSVKGVEMALYYIFQTGAGWAGPIGKAELVLNLPYPASAETLAGMPSGSLHLPPHSIPERLAGLPSGVVLDGYQARWVWTDFEPGPQDDFAIWLIKPGKWQELQAARAAVQAKPEDGETWLDLAFSYYSLSTTDRNIPMLFSPSYLPPGIAAYRKAVDLLPEHPVPHAGLGLLTLSPYMAAKDAPPEVMQSVQQEYQIARELNARNPSLLKEAGNSRWLLVWLEDALNNYHADYAIATVINTARSTDWADKTTEPVLEKSVTPVSSTAPQASSISAGTTGNGRNTVIIMLVAVFSLVALGYFVLKRRRRLK
jgi:hypothetical protein